MTASARSVGFARIEAMLRWNQPRAEPGKDLAACQRIYYRLMTAAELSELSVRQLLARRRRLTAGLSDPERTLRGVLLRKGRTCSSEGCRCRRGELHGPYTYLAIYADGRSRTVYVPAAVQIYLDLLNIFMAVLRVLGNRRN